MTPQDELRLTRALKSGDLSAEQELNVIRALKIEKGSAEELLGAKKSSTGLSRLQSFEDILGKDEQMFDYTTGAGGGLRAKLSFMETDEERQNFLRQRVGDEGFTKDSKGRLALTEAGQIAEGMEPIGKNLIIDERGASLRDVADVAGLAPEVLGSVIGGVLGAPGLVTGALGAGAGAAAGQAVEEGIEGLLGLQKQTAGEVGVDLAKEAALGATFDLAGNLIFKAGKAVITGAGKGANVVAKATGQGERELSSEAADRALRIMDEGGLPSYEAAGMPAALSRGSKIARSISGSKDQAERNIFFALAKKEQLLMDAGVSGVDEVADVIKNAVPAKAEQLKRAMFEAQEAHMKAVDDGIEQLSKATKDGVDLDESVLKVLTGNYDEFLKLSKANYENVDNILSTITKEVTLGEGATTRTITQTGATMPLFSMAPLRNQYDEIINVKYAGAAGDVVPDGFTKLGRQLKELSSTTAEGQRVGFTSFNGMKEFRKNINDALYDPTLSIQDTTVRKLLVDMRGQVDTMLGDSNMRLTGIGGASNAAKMKKALKAHKTAQGAYKKEIEVFTKLETLGILRNMGEAGRDVKLEAGRNFFKITENPQRIKSVLKAVETRAAMEGSKKFAKGEAEDVRRTLAAKYLDDALLNANKDAIDPLSFNGVQFYGQIQKIRRSGVGKELFGSDWPKVQALAKSLSYNGVKKMDDDLMQRIIQQNPGDDIVLSLTKVRDAQINLNEALSNKVLKDLAEGRVDPEEAAAAILNPNMTRGQMKKVLNFFEGDDAAKKVIKDAVIRDILGSVDENIFINENAAYSLMNALKSYKPETLKLVLGDDTVKGLNQLADDLVFLKDTGSKGAGSLAADAIRTGMVTAPMQNLPKVGRFKVLDRLLNNPDIMRKALEVRAGRTTPKAAAQSITQQLNEATAQVTGEGLSLTERAAGVGKTIGASLSAANRAGIVGRQQLGRSFESGQNLVFDRGDKPPQTRTSVPDVQPGGLQGMEIFDASQPTAAEKARKQESLRQRAAKNPYIAATLLGGLGSAGLL